jgi:hypothetical protein
MVNQARRYALLALKRAGEAGLPDEVLVSALLVAFRGATEAEARRVIELDESAGYIAGVTIPLEGKRWALTPTGILKASA